MTNTEIALLAIYRAPAIPLPVICKQYFNLSPAEAARKASLNALPVPTFKTRDSERAPLMVRVRELAEFLDAQADAAAKSHEGSKL